MVKHTLDHGHTYGWMQCTCSCGRPAMYRPSQATTHPRAERAGRAAPSSSAPFRTHSGAGPAHLGQKQQPPGQLGWTPQLAAVQAARNERLRQAGGKLSAYLYRFY
eukprot:268003-Pelagomonas_calceolata.AAC.2